MTAPFTAPAATGTAAGKFPAGPADITAEWATAALSQRHPGVVVTHLHRTQVLGGTATKVRLTLDYNDEGHRFGLPPTLWAKAGFGGHELASAMLAFYQSEVEFYDGPSAALDLGLPRSYYAGMDPVGGEALVLLEDLLARNASICVAGDAADVDLVARGLDFLARLHGGTWGAEQAAGLTLYPGALRGALLQVVGEQHWTKSIAKPRGQYVYEPLRDPATMQRAVEALWAWDAAHAVCRVHGDAHLGNLYVERDGRSGFLDWQMTGLGHWAFDVGYFVAGSLTPADRRSHERDLLRHYLDRLGEHGGQPPSFDEAWDAYRRHLVHGLFHVANADEMYPEETNCVVIERHSVATAELDALGLLLPS